MAEFYFDEEAADRATTFFQTYLRHVEGELAGRRLRLEKWQHRMVSDVFGWKRTDDDLRRFRTLYLEVPRKNGKTTLAAGFGLKLTCADDEPGARVISTAGDKEQARYCFDTASAMCGMEPRLRAATQRYKRSIVYPRTLSTYKVISSEASTKHGGNLHGIVFDELHAQKSRELYDVLTTSTGSRRQPLEVYITTAGWDRTSICWELHDYAVKVSAGIIPDSSFYPLIYGAADDADWHSEDVWHAVNPNLGVSKQWDYMRKMHLRACEVPGFENTFKRLDLDVWTEQANRWLPMKKWDACAGDVDAQALQGQRCFGGLDLSSTSDLTAFVLVFPDTDPLQVLCWLWLPAASMQKRVRRDRVPYDVWHREGLIEVTPGDVIDTRYIRHRVLQIGEGYKVQQIGFDPWNATDLVTQLAEDGVQMVACRQGIASMTAPSKHLEKLVLSRGLAHAGHAVLRWMASNVSVKMDAAANMKPDKKSSREKIDGIVALIIALGRAISEPEKRPSKYEGTGVLVVG